MSIETIMVNVDHIIISHLHPDHFDELAQRSIQKQMSILCQPSDKAAIESLGFTNVKSIQDYLKINSIIIERTQAIHGTGAIETVMGKTSGFVFKHPEEQTLYWTGDSIWCEEVQQTIFDNTPAVIVCHAGGNRFFKEHPVFGDLFHEDTEPVIMDANQVVELAYYALTSKIIATHIGALDHETITREFLREYAQSEGISPSQLFIPQDGDILNF
jgi:L-ascorbate metabolism protein UlaG (beta-lactamase superfamily)